MSPASDVIAREERRGSTGRRLASSTGGWEDGKVERCEEREKEETEAEHEREEAGEARQEKPIRCSERVVFGCGVFNGHRGFHWEKQIINSRNTRKS